MLQAPIMSPLGYDSARDQKRLRAGSISGRLRTASDLQELGWIDKTQKGIVKDLIISGNHALQTALDKFSTGDGSELQALIRQGLFSRKQSIDLLDGLDLDFLNVDRNDNNNGVDFHDHQEFSFEEQFESSTGGHHNMSNLHDMDNDGQHHLSNGLLMPELSSDWFEHNALLSHEQQQGSHSSNNNGHQPSLRKNSLLSGDLKDWGHMDYSTDHVMPAGEIFENVDLSLYSVMAANLQKTNSANNNAIPNTKFKSKNQAKSATPHKMNSIKEENRRSVSNQEHHSNNNNNNNGNNTRAKSDSNRKALDASLLFDNFTSSTNSSPSHNNNQASSTESFDSLMKYTNIASGPNSSNMSTSAASSTTGVTNSGTTSTNGTTSTATVTAGFVHNEDGSLAKLPADFIGAYSPESRRARIERFIEKRNRRVWTKKVKYDVRKNFADSRLRVKGRFVKKEDEELMRELLTI